jgi:hypothetical protein
MKREPSYSYCNNKTLYLLAESFIICCVIKYEEQNRIVKQEYNGYSLPNNKMIKSSLIAVGLIVIALLMLTQYQ